MQVYTNYLLGLPISPVTGSSDVMFCLPRLYFPAQNAVQSQGFPEFNHDMDQNMSFTGLNPSLHTRARPKRGFTDEYPLTWAFLTHSICIYLRINTYLSIY